MKISMIINPNAGKKKGLTIAEYTKQKLIQAGIEVEMHISRQPGQTVDLAKALKLENTDGVLAVGGDGTLFEVINGLLSQRDEITVPLGQIPVGTGNSFIKDLGVETVDSAIDMIIRGKTGPVDIGRFTCNEGSWYFINLLGAGFVSNVAYHAKRFKALGPLSYIIGVLEEVTRLSSVKTQLEIDGKVIERDSIFTEICNSRFTGGNMMMAPRALISDGLLDIIIMSKVTRRKLLSIFPSIFKGTHVDDDSIEVFQGKKIKLTTEKPLMLTPDGETFGSTPITAEIVPAKIRMFCK